MKRQITMATGAWVEIVLMGLTLIPLVGCVEKPRTEVTPTSGYSDEVPIFVYVSDPGNPHSLVVVPDTTYIVAEKQKAHWLPLQGALTDITFKDRSGAVTKPASYKQGVIGRLEKPSCDKGNCKMVTPPSELGTFGYSVTLQWNGKTYSIDPQLIVGR